MVTTFLKEETVSLTQFLAAPKTYLRGVVRVVDDQAQSIGVFLDKTALDELREAIESNSVEFLEKLESSRSSGRVSAAAVRKRLGP